MEPKSPISESELKERKQFCTFMLSGRHFGFDIFTTREVSIEANFTPIHHAPEVVKGYVNLRGQIYLVLDLGLLLGFEKSKITDESRILIFTNEVGESFGVLVDKIGDVVDVSEDEIEDLQGRKERVSAEVKAELDKLSMGVCKLENDLLVILNPSKLLEEVESIIKNN